jgi:hypothetical protein
LRGLGWHVISGEQLLDALRRCAAGADPDLIYAEMWANADHEEVTDDDRGS